MTLFTDATFGQATVHDKTLFSLSILPLAPTLEIPISDHGTLYVQGGLGSSVLVENYTNMGPRATMTLRPFALGQYRLYYHLFTRELAGKSAAFNSGNFWGVMTQYTFESIAGNGDDLFTERWGLSLGPIWGLQRNTAKFIFGFSMGSGVRIFESRYAARTVNNHVTEIGSQRGVLFDIFGSLNVGIPLAGFR